MRSPSLPADQRLPRGERTQAEAAAGTVARTDIQGLRAVAVAAVVLYHLWPHRLTRGYVGVDVFFVISGFLITSHLLRRPVVTVRGLLDFWARRVRRLIPAATLVLAATLVAAALWLPTTARRVTILESLAAMFYVENWRLAATETDYLAAGHAATPVQHFWSLSIEEQFYLLWPVLLGAAALAAAWLARRLARRPEGRAPDPQRTALLAAGGVVGAVALASFAWSVHLTATAPAAAYFVSTTRAWELALGGLVAVLTSRPAAASPPGQPSPSSSCAKSQDPGRTPAARRDLALPRTIAACAGLAAVVVAAVTFTGATPFPGWAALLPTGGAALVLAADADGLPLGPGRLLARRPLQWLGDISYGVYLWHWPLIVILPFALGGELRNLTLLALLGASLLLGWLSKVLVEDRVRHHRALTGRPGPSFLLLLGCVAVVTALGVVLLHRADQEAARAQTRAQAAIAQHEPCVGAGVTRDAACADPGVLVPPEVAAADRPALYADGCWNNAPYTSRNTCTYGPGAGDAGAAGTGAGSTGGAPPAARVALLGNSHVGHWFPALEAALPEHGWELTTYVSSVCYPVALPLAFDDPAVTRGCQELGQWAVRSVADGGYDVVVMSSRTNQPLLGIPDDEQAAAAQEGYAATLRRLTDAGVPVLVIRDTPAMPESVPDCLARERDPAPCGVRRTVGLEPDPLFAAAEADTSGLVSTLDLTGVFCDDVTCAPVVGGLVAFFDHGHLTASLARTLAPDVVEAVERALRE